MSFDYDIFISYGHLDDENPDDVKGWVDLLVERLPGQMQGHLAYKPRVWRDEQSLRLHDRLEDAIRDGVESSLLFVPVLTPRYVLSGWCRDELEIFCASPPPVYRQTAADRVNFYLRGCPARKAHAGRKRADMRGRKSLTKSCTCISFQPPLRAGAVTFGVAHSSYLNASRPCPVRRRPRLRNSQTAPTLVGPRDCLPIGDG